MAQWMSPQQDVMISYLDIFNMKLKMSGTRSTVCFPDILFIRCIVLALLFKIPD